jgi:hypothetical protein
MKTIPFTIYEYFIKIVTSQDFQQKLQMSISVTLEFYRVLVSSLLVIFVPHSCGDHICTIQETVHYEKTKYTMVNNKLYNICFVCFACMFAKFAVRKINKITRS